MAAVTSEQPCISQSMLADISQNEMTFYDTSFFNHDPESSRQLPTPASVLERSRNGGRSVVKYDDLQLVVKFGPFDYSPLEEAQTMRAIRQAFPHGEVPVPEVFGWRKHEGLNFIYMSLVEGRTMRQAWPSLNEAEKETLCADLGRIVACLQRLTHDLRGIMIGTLPTCYVPKFARKLRSFRVYRWRTASG